MKRRVFLFILAAALCWITAAFAAELTWDQNCRKKTSSSTMLYVLLEGEDTLTPTSALPAGTYIRTTGQTVEGKTGISYSANNCDPLYGYIDGSVIVNATTTVKLPNGDTVTVGEALVRSRAALNSYLEMEFGVTLEGGTYTDENGEEHEIGNEAAGGGVASISGDMKWARAMNSAFADNGSYTRTVYRDEEGNETEVEVSYMGLTRSMIVLDGEEQLVETWRLSWETKAPEDKVLAVVRSKSQNVKFHAGSGSSTMVLTRLTTNHVYRVIDVKGGWALVDIDDPQYPRGYISTQYLEFYRNIHLAYKTAQVSVLGRTKGSDPVWIRAEDSSSGYHLVEFDLGTPLSVYAQNGKWCEVDVGGYHAFILSQYVTMDEAVTADAQ